MPSSRSSLRGRSRLPVPGGWCEDDSEYAGAVAYHTLTAEGLPQVKISVANAKQANWAWTMAASHDLMEMLANPMLKSHGIRRSR